MDVEKDLSSHMEVEMELELGEEEVQSVDASSPSPLGPEDKSIREKEEPSTRHLENTLYFLPPFCGKYELCFRVIHHYLKSIDQQKKESDKVTANKFVLVVFTSSLVSETAFHLMERWFIHARETKIVRVQCPVLPLDWSDFRRKEAVVFISSTLLRRALMTSVGTLDHIGLLILDDCFLTLQEHPIRDITVQYNLCEKKGMQRPILVGISPLYPKRRLEGQQAVASCCTISLLLANNMGATLPTIAGDMDEIQDLFKGCDPSFLPSFVSRVRRPPDHIVVETMESLMSLSRRLQAMEKEWWDREDNLSLPSKLSDPFETVVTCLQKREMGLQARDDIVLRFSMSGYMLLHRLAGVASLAVRHFKKEEVTAASVIESLLTEVQTQFEDPRWGMQSSGKLSSSLSSCRTRDVPGVDIIPKIFDLLRDFFASSPLIGVLDDILSGKIDDFHWRVSKPRDVCITQTILRHVVRFSPTYECRIVIFAEDEENVRSLYSLSNAIPHIRAVKMQQDVRFPMLVDIGSYLSEHEANVLILTSNGRTGIDLSKASLGLYTYPVSRPSDYILSKHKASFYSPEFRVVFGEENGEDHIKFEKTRCLERLMTAMLRVLGRETLDRRHHEEVMHLIRRDLSAAVNLFRLRFDEILEMAGVDPEVYGRQKFYLDDKIDVGEVLPADDEMGEDEKSLLERADEGVIDRFRAVFKAVFRDEPQWVTGKECAYSKTSSLKTVIPQFQRNRGAHVVESRLWRNRKMAIIECARKGLEFFNEVAPILVHNVLGSTGLDEIGSSGPASTSSALGGIALAPSEIVQAAKPSSMIPTNSTASGSLVSELCILHSKMFRKAPDFSVEKRATGTFIASVSLGNGQVVKGEEARTKKEARGAAAKKALEMIR